MHLEKEIECVLSIQVLGTSIELYARTDLYTLHTQPTFDKVLKMMNF